MGIQRFVPDRKIPLSVITDGFEEQPWVQDWAGLGRIGHPAVGFVRHGGERRPGVRGRGGRWFILVYL